MTPLTRSQRQIMQRLAQGIPVEEIATERGITEHTARTHIANAMVRLDVHTRAAAVAVCMREGYIR